MLPLTGEQHTKRASSRNFPELSSLPPPPTGGRCNAPLFSSAVPRAESPKRSEAENPRAAAAMTDYAQEQEMEIEALQAILMDDIQEIDSSESGLSRINRCFQIMPSPQDDDVDESNYTPVKLALIFSHTEKYPDEPPLLNLKSVRGIKPEDLSVLKEKLQKEVAQNLGMAMVYTLVTSAKDWLSENFGREVVVEESEETDTTKDDVWLFVSGYDPTAF